MSGNDEDRARGEVTESEPGAKGGQESSQEVSQVEAEAPSTEESPGERSDEQPAGEEGLVSGESGATGVETQPQVEGAQGAQGDEQGQHDGSDTVAEGVEIDLDLDDTSEGNADVPGEEAQGGADDAPADGEVEQPSGDSSADAVVALERRIEEMSAELERTKNQLLRVAADFENYRKRMQRQMADTEARAMEKVLVEVLPVMDSLALALDHVDSDGDGASLTEGVQLVVKQFRSILSKLGVEPIEALGQPFDPTYHEAMQQEESTDVPPGTVLKEWQKGYLVGDKLLRPSMVVVSAAPAEAAAPEPTGADEAEGGAGEAADQETKTAAGGAEQDAASEAGPVDQGEGGDGTSGEGSGETGSERGEGTPA